MGNAGPCRFSLGREAELKNLSVFQESVNITSTVIPVVLVGSASCPGLPSGMTRMELVAEMQWLPDSYRKR